MSPRELVIILGIFVLIAVPCIAVLLIRRRTGPMSTGGSWLRVAVGFTMLAAAVAYQVYQTYFAQ